MEYRDIEDILSRPYHFIDKSLFIKHWIEDPAPIRVFLRPRLTGKSVNCSLLRYFLDVQHEPSPAFRRLLQISHSKYTSLTGAYAGRYSVVLIDWKASGVLQACSGEDFEIKLVDYLVSVLCQHTDPYLLSSLSSSYYESRSDLVAQIGRLKRATSLEDLQEMLLVLCRFLNTVNEEQVVLIVDGYDDVYLKAEEVGFRIGPFLSRFFSLATGNMNSPIFKVAAFGVHRFQDDGPFAGCQLNGKEIAYSTVYNDDPYRADFGFTDGEISEFMRNYRLTEMTIDDLRNWYFIDSADPELSLLHPYSIAAALKTRKFTRHWTREAPLCMTSFPLSKIDQFGVGDLLELTLLPQNHNLSLIHI